MSNPIRPVSGLTNHSFAAIVASVAVLTSITFANARAAEITAYTIRSVPLNAPTDVAIVHVDSADLIEERISAGLPADPSQAVTVARQRLLEGGAALQRELTAAYEGVAEAWSLGITTLPAVVIDRHYVVYGEADVAKAIARIEAYRKAQQ